MDVFFDSFWGAIETLVALGALALAASFSPILYAAQLRTAYKSHRLLRNAYAPVVGAIAAIITMLVIFQFLSLDTLVHIIGSTIGALIVSTSVAMLVGFACIYGGVRFMRQQDKAVPKTDTISTKSSSALIGFGFARTFFSVSGLSAAFLGANLIAETGHGLLVQSVLTGFFLVVAAIPFVTIAYLVARLPASVISLARSTKRIATQIQYRYYIGVLFIAVGSGIVVFQTIQVIMR